MANTGKALPAIIWKVPGASSEFVNLREQICSNVLKAKP